MAGNEAGGPRTKAIFREMDVDDSGGASLYEFAVWFKEVGISKRQAAAAFKSCDVDGESIVGADELHGCIPDG